MKILAIETATEACSVALLLPDRCIESYQWAPKAHSHLLLSMIDGLLQEGQLCFSDIDALAFGCGPGSLTGVRIGCSTIQGLSVGGLKPVISLSSLRILAQGISQKTKQDRLFVYLPAQSQRVYGAYYGRDQQGLMQLEGAEALYDTAALPIHGPIATGFPRAADALQMAAIAYEAGLGIEASQLSPVYLSTLFQ